MKYLLLIFIITFAYLPINAQDYIFGIKGGINNNTIGSLYQRPYNNQPGINHQPNKEIGYQIGAYFGVEYGSFFLSPEINYVTLNNNYELPLRKASWSSSKLEIPVLLGFKIVKPLIVYVGPNFNFSRETILEGVQVTSYSDGGPDLERNTVSFNIGVMYRYKRFGVDLRLEKGNKATQEELLDIIYSSYGTNLADLRSYTPDMIKLSVFIDIFRTDGSSFMDLFKGKDNCGCPY